MLENMPTDEEVLAELMDKINLKNEIENEIENEERDEEEIDEVAPEPVRELAAPSINKKKSEKKLMTDYYSVQKKTKTVLSPQIEEIEDMSE